MKVNLSEIKDVDNLVKFAKRAEGKMLFEISPSIIADDDKSRVRTKGVAGYVSELLFGIQANSNARPDIEHLDVEIKTCPLKYNKDRTKLSVKEPLSGNIINYCEEVNNNSLIESSFYKKNRKVLFFWYIHDKERKRSEYIIKYVFLWEMNEQVVNELEPDYKLILERIRAGRAHEIHQTEHEFLTICPKHNGKFHDPNCTRSKRKQPFSDKPAEVRAFRLKNRYMNMVIRRYLGLPNSTESWSLKNEEILSLARLPTHSFEQRQKTLDRFV